MWNRYTSEEDENVNTRKAKYQHGEIYKEYYYLKCVEPAFLKESDIIKKLHIAVTSADDSAELLGREQVGKEYLD